MEVYSGDEIHVSEYFDNDSFYVKFTAKMLVMDNFKFYLNLFKVLWEVDLFVFMYIFSRIP